MLYNLGPSRKNYQMGTIVGSPSDRVVNIKVLNLQDYLATGLIVILWFQTISANSNGHFQDP